MLLSYVRGILCHSSHHYNGDGTLTFVTKEASFNQLILFLHVPNDRTVNIVYMTYHAFEGSNLIMF